MSDQPKLTAAEMHTLARAWYLRQCELLARRHGPRWPQLEPWLRAYLREQLRQRLVERGAHPRNAPGLIFDEGR